MLVPSVIFLYEICISYFKIEIVQWLSILHTCTIGSHSTSKKPLNTTRLRFLTLLHCVFFYTIIIVLIQPMYNRFLKKFFSRCQALYYLQIPKCSDNYGSKKAWWKNSTMLFHAFFKNRILTILR